MPLDLSLAVQAACLPSPWDLGNNVLYQLCQEHPLHNEAPAVLAKIWLIGRSYAAAIERRREKEGQNDDFYIQTVAPTIIASDIDSWLASAATNTKLDETSLHVILSVHASVTNLFNDISGLGKRSLASKYLHFHLPNLFYIYDSRAVEAMRFLSLIVGRANVRAPGADSEYRKFSEKCLRLQMHVHKELGMSLTPRQIDNLLLHIHATES